jgi:hypothetical protein
VPLRTAHGVCLLQCHVREGEDFAENCGRSRVAAVDCLLDRGEHRSLPRRVGDASCRRSPRSAVGRDQRHDLARNRKHNRTSRRGKAVAIVAENAGGSIGCRCAVDASRRLSAADLLDGQIGPSRSAGCPCAGRTHHGSSPGVADRFSRGRDGPRSAPRDGRGSWQRATSFAAGGFGRFCRSLQRRGRAFRYCGPCLPANRRLIASSGG